MLLTNDRVPCKYEDMVLGENVSKCLRTPQA